MLEKGLGACVFKERAKPEDAPSKLARKRVEEGPLTLAILSINPLPLKINLQSALEGATVTF